VAPVAGLRAAPEDDRDARSELRLLRQLGCACEGGRLRVEVAELADVMPLKARLGVPEALMSCHTAEIGGYVVEGHVPAEAIKRLLAERPQAKGIAVAGMPIGSPGMEIPGQPSQPYEVILFSTDAQRIFTRYRGLQQI
jgi:hypothetical protein